MDLRQLQHFLAVLEHGSLKRAADVVSVSQQGLSASIKALEDSLGVRLLDRGRLGAVPTAAGRALAEHAQQILGQARLARAELKSLASADSGTAVVGVGPLFAQRLMPAAIRELSAQRPNVSVRVTEGPSDTLCQMLLEGQIDFVASTPSASFEMSPDLESQILFEDYDVPKVRAEHPLARAPRVTLADLAKYPWIFSARYVGDRESVLRMFTKAGIAPPTQLVLTDSVSIITELLRTRDYVHVNGRTFFVREFSTVNCVSLDVPEFGARRVGMIAMRRGGRMAPASRALLDRFLAVWAQASVAFHDGAAHNAARGSPTGSGAR